MQLHYGGQSFKISAMERAQDLIAAAAAKDPTLRKIRFADDSGTGLFLLGGGIPVAFTTGNGDDLPEPPQRGSAYARSSD